MKASRYVWILVALLWGVGLLNYLDRQIIFSLFPLLRVEFKVSDAQLGLLTPAFLWIYGALSPLAGFLADRFSRKKIILVSLAVWSIVTWLTGYASSFSQLLSARALMGISEAFYIPAALALIADHHSERTRSLAIGLHQSGLYLGVILGGWLGGRIGEQFGWRTAFTVLGIVGVGYAAVLFFGMKEATESDQNLFPVREKLKLLDALKILFSVRNYWLLGLAFTCFSIAGWIVLTWMPLYLFEHFRMSLTQSGFTATFYIQVAAFAGILGGGFIADRWSRKNHRARLFLPAVGFFAGCIFLFLVGWTSSTTILISGLLVYGLSRGLMDCTAMPILCQIVPENLRATGYGIFNLVGCIVGGTMAALAGLLKNSIGISGSLQISALILAIAGFALLSIRLKNYEA